MKIMICPVNGARNIAEFAWGGEVKPDVDPATCTDQAWTDHLFLEANIAGMVTEWWLHTPTNTWFIARRNTLTDEILETMTLDAYYMREGAISA